MKRTIAALAVLLLIAIPMKAQNGPDEEYALVLKEYGSVTSISESTVNKLESELRENYQKLLKEYGSITPDYFFLTTKEEYDRVVRLSLTHTKLVNKKLISNSDLDGKTVFNLIKVLVQYSSRITESGTKVTDRDGVVKLNQKMRAPFNALMESPYFPKDNYKKQNELVKEKIEKLCKDRMDILESYNQKISEFEIDYEASYPPRGEIKSDGSYEYDGKIVFKNVPSKKYQVWYNIYVVPKEAYLRDTPYKVKHVEGLHWSGEYLFKTEGQMMQEIKRCYDKTFKNL